MPVKVVNRELDSILTPEQQKERFERYRSRCVVDPETGCWLHQGITAQSGYGMVRVKFRLWPAHRFMWVASRGAVPEDWMVLHRCDVKNCINPDHLFLGTHLDNVQDKCVKGRHRNGSTGPLAENLR